MKIINILSIAISFTIISIVFSQGHTQSQDVKKDKNIIYQQPIVFEVINIRSGNPSLSHYWDSLPNIRICEGSRVTQSRARNSVRYWERMGYNLGDLIFDNERDFQTCFNGGNNGEITVMLITSDIPIDTNLAVTKVFFDTRTNKIIKAQIFVIGGYANKERLLEHEIGHALGWSHYNRYLHIMNSSYDETGHNSHGVSWINYQREIERISQ